MMLDLSVLVQRLTQGQAPAAMTPLSTAQAPSAAGEGAATTGQAPSGNTASAPAAVPVDARLVADRVYELMRKDLLIFNERAGRK